MAQQTRWLVLDKGTPSYNSQFLWSEQSFIDGAFLETLRTVQVGTYRSAPYPSMSLVFNGTEFVLLGQFTKGKEGTVPNWSCTLDGNSIEVVRLPEEGHFSCSGTSSSDSAHNFTLGIVDSTEGSLSFDSFWYLPTYDSVRPKDAYVVYRHDDPDISRTGSWKTIDHGGSNATLTEEEGATLTMTYTGSIAIAEGWSPAGYIAGVSDCTYIVKPGTYSPGFKVEPPDPTNETIHNKLLFTTSEAKSVGELKNLTVTYKGPNAPLAIERFFVKDGNFRIGDNPAAPAPSGGTGGSSSGNDGLNTIGNILKIAVPTVVGFFVLCFVVGCFTGCWNTFAPCCKRNKRPNSATPGGDDKDLEMPPYSPPHNESGQNLMHGDQFYQPYHQPYHYQTPTPPPPPPYQRPGMNQSISGLSVDGGGTAHVAGRDNNNITIHNYNVHPDAFNSRNPY